MSTLAWPVTYLTFNDYPDRFTQGDRSSTLLLNRHAVGGMLRCKDPNVPGSEYSHFFGLGQYALEGRRCCGYYWNHGIQEFGLAGIDTSKVVGAYLWGHCYFYANTLGDIGASAGAMAIYIDSESTSEPIWDHVAKPMYYEVIDQNYLSALDSGHYSSLDEYYVWRYDSLPQAISENRAINVTKAVKYIMSHANQDSLGIFVKSTSGQGQLNIPAEENYSVGLGYRLLLTIVYTDTMPPVISNISAANIGLTTANISWTTDESTISKVIYGLSGNDNLSVITPGYVTSHSMPLTGLQKGTQYSYRVISVDLAGNADTSTSGVFTTKSAPIFSTLSSDMTNSVKEDYPYGDTVSAIDPDNDTLIFAVLAGPAGLAVGNATGIIIWTPVNSQVGSHPVSIKVTDIDGLTDTLSFNVAVVNTNDAPVFTARPDTAGKQDTLYSYTAIASESDAGDHLIYRLIVKPFGMVIDSSTGLITWTPVSAQVGDTNVTVVAVDDSGATATQSYRLHVFNIQISSVPDTNATEDSLWKYVVSVADSGNNFLSYTLQTRPWNMTISRDTLRWTPRNADVGVHTVKIKVSDGKGGEVFQTFRLYVANVNDAPFFILLKPASDTTITEGDSITFKAAAIDFDPGDTVFYLWLVDSLVAGSADSCVVRTGLASAGVDTVKVIATDGSMVQVEHKWVLTVLEKTGLEKTGRKRPVTFALEGGYPNPFNPSTEIRFTVPAGEGVIVKRHVTLRIYNAAGRMVKTLADGRTEPGYYSAVFDGKARNGCALGSGIYYCIMKAEGFEATKVLLMMK